MAAKSSHIMVNVEPVVYTALEQLIIRESENNASMSAKVRRLIIQHLIERHVLTAEMLEE